MNEMENSNRRTSNKVDQGHSFRKSHNFYINNNTKNSEEYKHKDNTVDTSKYNIITFLPKSLLYQFMRLANCYFLLIAIIQCIKVISPLSPFTAVAPIAIVLFESIIREAAEDYARHKYDKMMNSEKVRVFKNGKFEEEVSGSLKIGEIILVKENDPLPADIILIDSSLEGGVAYIETATLDGEKTLKSKVAHKVTAGFLNNNGECKATDFEISGNCTCDAPNSDLYKLEGNVTISMRDSQNSEVKESTIPIEAKQLLLKGAILKNTQWVVGFIIYTGKNTKLILNSKKPRVKFSRVEHLMSKMLIGILTLQMIICLICAVLHKSDYVSTLILDPYIPPPVQNITVDSVISYFTYLLLLNTMIPISLIITLDIVKAIQGFFITVDVELYSHVRKEFAKAGSISLNEELGQINYIFSDKTGTLTCNKMIFKYCVIGDVCYEYQKDIKKSSENKSPNEGYNNTYNLNNRPNEEESKLKEEASDVKVFGPNAMFAYVNKYSKKMMNVDNQSLNNATMNFTRSRYENYKFSCEKNPDCFIKMDEDYLLIDEYWKALSIAHECVCNQKETGEIEYSGVSPDDIELVKTAADQGYSFLPSPRTDIRRVKIGNEVKEFEVLRILEFNSDRKRMSIIIRDGSGHIKLYSKGADSEIKKRLSSKSRKDFLDQANAYVENFSAKGLRTLLFAMKVIDLEYYEDWSKRLEEAELNLNNKEAEITKCYAEIESHLYLLGATVVEDKLQDQVPETIRDLRLAGIKVWMLTGDKMNTAYNIGLSCNLISKSSKIFTLKGEEGDTLNSLVVEFNKFCRNFNNNINGSFIDGDFQKCMSFRSSQPFSILIDSVALSSVLSSVGNQKTFMKMACHSSSVICCRVSPLQKSEVVSMVKDFDKSAVSLSIGDGGNDVSMIMEAHIGVGVYGEEGMRAVQASDFAIGEFKLLRRFLMFHGRVNNIRISEMILYFFYKNFIFTIIQFYYGFYNDFSGQTIIDDWFISLYNLIFTAFPLGARACSDFDLLPEDGVFVDKMMPFLYKENRDNRIFTKTFFILSLIRGIVFGLISFFITIFILNESAVDGDGNVADLWYTSGTIFTSIIFVVSLRIIIVQKHFIWLIPAIMVVTSWFTYSGFVAFVQFIHIFNSIATMGVLFGSSKLYLCFTLVVTTTTLIDKAVYTYGILFGNKISALLMIQRKMNGKLEDINKCPKIIKEELKKYTLYEESSHHLVFSDSPNIANLKDFNNADRAGALEFDYSLKEDMNLNIDPVDEIMDKPYSKKFSMEIEKIAKHMKSNPENLDKNRRSSQLLINTEKEREAPIIYKLNAENVISTRNTQHKKINLTTKAKVRLPLKEGKEDIY